MAQGLIKTLKGMHITAFGAPRTFDSNGIPSRGFGVARYIGVLRNVIRAIAGVILLATFSAAANATCADRFAKLQDGQPAHATDVTDYVFNCPTFPGDANFAGNVTIGTASPLRTLNVVGNLSVSGTVTCGSGCGSSGGGGSGQWTTSGSNISFNAGNVGIGTANPAYQLTVYATAYPYIGLSNQYGNNAQLYTDGNGNLVLDARSSWAGGGISLLTKANGGIVVNGAYRNAAGMSLDVQNGSGSTVLGVFTSGNVGIGTSSPSQALHVVGNIYATGNITCGGTCGGGGGTSQWTTTGSNISFSTGNVGIGTANPAALLSVGSTNQFMVLGAGQVFGSYFAAPNVAIGYHTSSLTGIYYELSHSSVDNPDTYLSSPAAGYVYFGTAKSGSSQYNGTIIAGSIGIGTTSPSYALHVNGTAYATGAAGSLSDIRDKKDVTSLSILALDAIAKLRPVTFFWKSPKDEGMKGQQTGLIAQEVEKVLPSTILTAKDARKSKAIKYDELTAVLIKAIQEQQKLVRNQQALLQMQGAAIKEQRAQINHLQVQNAKLEERMGRVESKRLARTN